MKKNTLTYGTLFLAGAVIYPLIEILFRGYTHLSMSLLGGICAAAVYWVDETLGKVRIVWKAAACACIITQLELICGLVVNRLLNMQVWDYSHLRWNLAGQICPLFTFFWFLLSWGAILLFRWIKRSFHYKYSKKSTASTAN